MVHISHCICENGGGMFRPLGRNDLKKRNFAVARGNEKRTFESSVGLGHSTTAVG